MATGLEVHKLARAGAGVSDGVHQAEGIGRKGQCVFVELGGNDLLGSTRASDYAQGLERLLASLRADGHQVVMFEIPLVPFCNGFGRVQRVLAGRYEAQLIPKRILTRVMGMPGATSDGLHLSAKGHRALAQSILGMMTPPKRFEHLDPAW
jgi:lysophospholipase L1-like esterase